MQTFPAVFDLVVNDFRLRRLLPEDARELARIRQDEDTIRWAQPSGCTEAGAVELIAGAERMWASGEAAELAIVPLRDDTLLGTINLKFYGPTRASIGYDLAPEARGAGIATRALESLSEWAFTVFPDLVRLELWIIVGNAPSIRVAERAGFQREGVLRSRLPFGSELRDVVVFSLLRSDRR